MSGCAVPEQRGTLSPVGSSWSAVELLSDEWDPSPGFGHVIQDHVGPSIQLRAEGVLPPRNTNINIIDVIMFDGIHRVRLTTMAIVEIANRSRRAPAQQHPCQILTAG
jgi:hypothetical protein